MEKHYYSTHPPRKKEGLTTFSTTVKSMEKHSDFVSLRQPKEGEDALLHEEDDESLTQEGMHECLEEKMDSMELSECNGLLHKLHNNRAKIGWANRVWDPGKSFMDPRFWEITHCMGALRSLNPPGHTNFKH
ncbi:hypothetical protein PIB30_055197 [Stylosanthes scabra]|uniref:Uncharacterized protein n=1 Tax=Stylosanthes scabra TaxID=79078 RepID=A0ABU6QIV1_9FABA|nr:hypothetical protein [Stylosanthes scabra]